MEDESELRNYLETPPETDFHIKSFRNVTLIATNSKKLQTLEHITRKLFDKVAVVVNVHIPSNFPQKWNKATTAFQIRAVSTIAYIFGKLFDK